MMRQNSAESYRNELESKIQILEQENETLSARAEENLLLSKAFAEINQYDNIDNIQQNILESISILLNIPFSGIFHSTENGFTCSASYALFNNDDGVFIELTVSTKAQHTINSQQFYFSENNEAILLYKSPNTLFESKNILIISLESEIYTKTYFVFGYESNDEAIEQRIPLLKKVIRIISSKMERIFYQTKLQTTNKELQLSNEELQAINEELFNKNTIIIDQNTELKATLQHLQETQSQLIEAEKMASLGVLTAGVAHEINNPLNYIMGGSIGLETLLTEANKLDADILTLLESIRVGVDRASAIVRSLNQFSRNNEVDTENCDVHSIIENCLLILTSQLKDRIDVHKNYANVYINVLANVGKLHQVFINILTNAIQGITGKGSLSITTSIKNNRSVIDITDTGCGIPKENLSKITEPFFTTKPPGQGTGLGLSITYSILKEYNANLHIESTVNKGTTVTIDFPITEI